MELKWDVEEAAAAAPYVFSRDLFEKFTLAPNVKELFALLHSSDVKPKDAGEKEATAESQSVKSDVKSDVSNVFAADEPTAERKPTEKPKPKAKPEKNSDVSAFPEPLVPYPCFTKINAKDRRSYLSMLKTRNYKKASKRLMELVRDEATEFMKYLQEVSRLCADGYNYLPPDATRYTEEYFSACLDLVKSYPQVYGIQEITSLTSLKFVCEISLNFEKQILAMGKTDMVKENAIPANTPLAVEYQTVAKVVSPAKKAHAAHNAISSDSNAEKLSATYEPHVCLAKEAFVQLLNNSSELTEAWELPVWVRMNPGKGSCQSKTAFIDAPLLKTEVSCRERSLLFHEESLKLLFTKTSTRPVFFLTGEELSFESTPPAEDKASRSVVTFDDTSLDFEADLTDLESFGESYKPTKKTKDQNKPKATGPKPAPSPLNPSPKKPTDSSDAKKPTSPSQDTPETGPEEQAEIKTALDDGGKTAERDNEESETPSVQCPPAKRLRCLKDDQTEPDSDSDEGRLIIDHIVSPQRPPAQEPAASLEPAAPGPANPLGGKGVKKGVKRQRVSGECDQLGQILKMQDAMLKSTPSKSQEAVKAHAPGEKHPEVKSHSLVKTCVSSYLESRAGQEEDGSLPVDTPLLLSAQRKRLLREDLQASAEDELDYDPPAEGSVFYKLYSLQDVLLMVRSSVDIAHPKHDRKTFRAVPVHILPKMEYQLCYGAESLTHTEACQLWAEKLLHSSTESFISRINAHTSEVAQVQKLPDDWIQTLTCDFKPARCLNTLYHLLKKVSALQEGRYMLVHKPREGFVTIYKASDEAKAVRGVFNLQATHCGPPPVPPGVPWVPLDPTHVLPFHQKHNRPPCTFPPRPPPQPKAKVGPKRRQRKKACRQPQASNASANPTDSPKTKKKRAAQMKLSKLDNMRVKLLKDLQTSEDE